MSESIVVRRSKQAAQAIMLTMACVSPWAFGAVEAWAEFGLDIGVLLLAILSAVVGWRTGQSQSQFCLPSVAIVGLAVLALAEALPLPQGLFERASPTTAALHKSLLPTTPDKVLGDQDPPVSLPPPTLSQVPEASLHFAARLAAAWILFQSVLALDKGVSALRLFGVATAVNATLMALFSVVQMLTWDGKIYWYWPSPSPLTSAGPFVCHSHLAAYLNVGLGFSVAFLLSPDSAKQRSDEFSIRLWSAYSVGILVIGILASLSRNGFMSMLGALAITTFAFRSHSLRSTESAAPVKAAKRSRSTAYRVDEGSNDPTWWDAIPRRLLQIGAAVGALLVILPLLLYGLGSAVPYQDRLSTLLVSQPYEQRIQIWADVIQGFLRFPIFGVGLGSFSSAATRFLQHETGVHYEHAENEYVEWLVEGGVLGFGLVLIAVIGVARLARGAWKSSSSPRDRCIIWGACFGCIAILIDGLGDFAMHIPAIAITAVILCGHLCKLGLESRGEDRESSVPKPGLAAAAFSSLTLPILGVVVVGQGFGLARAEALYHDFRRTSPKVERPKSMEDADQSELAIFNREIDAAQEEIDEMERRRASLEKALEYRPNWAEGYLHLGAILLSLYEKTCERELVSQIRDPDARAVIAKPLWLHRQLHKKVEPPESEQENLMYEGPIRDYLVPAAHAFLQARRCCLVSAIPYVELANLDFLLIGDESGADLLERGLSLSGADSNVLSLATNLAQQIDNRVLLIRAMRKRLRVTEQGWETVADYAYKMLKPDQILGEVIPSGRLAILFAERYYGLPEDDYDHPDDERDREAYAREGLRRLPTDLKLSQGERLELEALALALLDDRTQARDRMTKALVLEPRQYLWRIQFVEWLLEWGDFEEAHSQAVICAALSPPNSEVNRILRLAARALVTGKKSSGTSMPETSP